MVNALLLMLVPPAIVICLPFHMIYAVLVTGICGSAVSLSYWPWLAWKSLVLVATTQRVGPIARSMAMLPWLLIAVISPVLAVCVCIVASVCIGFASACVGGWALIDGGDCAESVTLLKELFSGTLDAVRDIGTQASSAITDELAFRNDRTPPDANPLHLLEGVAGWVLALVPVVLATVVMAFVKVLLNIATLLSYTLYLLSDIEAQYIPCMCCCLPLLVVAVLGLMPAALLVAAALSPLVALCYSAVFAAKAVYTSYLVHYDVPLGTRVSCYWPVLPRAMAGALYSVSLMDELYGIFSSSHACCRNISRKWETEGLYGGCFERHFEFSVDPPRRDGGGAANLTNLTGAVAPPPPPAGEPRLERQSSSLAGIGNLLSMASVWRSFFDSCETAGALALVEGWVTLDAVQGADPSVFIGIPALVVLQAALRSLDAGETSTIHLADGRTIGAADLPAGDFAQEVYGQMVQLLGALWELRPSNEEREYLQAAVASGGDEGGVRVAMPASLQAEPDSPDAAGDDASVLPSDGSGSASKEGDLVDDTSSGDAAAELQRRQAAMRSARNISVQLGLSATRKGVFRRKFARVLRSIGGS